MVLGGGVLSVMVTPGLAALSECCPWPSSLSAGVCWHARAHVAALAVTVTWLLFAPTVATCRLQDPRRTSC